MFTGLVTKAFIQTEIFYMRQLERLKDENPSVFLALLDRCKGIGNEFNENTLAALHKHQITNELGDINKNIQMFIRRNPIFGNNIPLKQFV